MGHGTHRVAALAAIAGWLVAAPLPARADGELVADGGFDDPTLSAWSLAIFDTSSITWEDVDADGAMGSGSVLFQKKLGEQPNSLRVEQCVPVVPGGDYTLSGQVFVPTQTATGDPFVEAQWFSSLHCGPPSFPSLSASGASAPPGAWTAVGPVFGTAPVEAHSAVLLVGVVVTVDTMSSDVFSARWDDVSLLPEPGATAEVVAAVVLALLAARRRRI